VIPPRRLVLLYVTTAHISLALAFALVGSDPLAVAGFFYHSRMVAIVHLVTIGWIAMSILGNLYIVMPMTCGRPLPARKGDYAAYALVVIGLIGMVSHFWLAEFSGMAWSAATAAAGVLYVVVRLAWNLRHARVPGGVKLHMHFAMLNLLFAVTMGVLLGFDKVYQFLPGYVLSNVFAHAHLAAVGWVCMIVVGLAYRLLPMLIPAASPVGPTIYISAILLETGVVGLFVSLVLRNGFSWLFALAIVAGFVAAGTHVLWMLRRRRRSPAERSDGGFAVAHVATAAVWLLISCVVGVTLTLAQTTDTTLRAALLYGVFGLVGFLAQVIVGFEAHVLPTAAAYWALQRSGGAAIAAPASSELRRSAIYIGWLAGVPAIGAGLFVDAPMVLSAGAWLLFGAVVLGAVDVANTVRRSGKVRTL
jgi:cbb3-type cytochrome oxidase subunit 1